MSDDAVELVILHRGEHIIYDIIMYRGFLLKLLSAVRIRDSNLLFATCKYPVLMHSAPGGFHATTTKNNVRGKKAGASEPLLLHVNMDRHMCGSIH